MRRSLRVNSDDEGCRLTNSQLGFEPMPAQAGLTIIESTYPESRTRASYTCRLGIDSRM